MTTIITLFLCILLLVFYHIFFRKSGTLQDNRFFERVFGAFVQKHKLSTSSYTTWAVGGGPLSGIAIFCDSSNEDYIRYIQEELLTYLRQKGYKTEIQEINGMKLIHSEKFSYGNHYEYIYVTYK